MKKPCLEYVLIVAHVPKIHVCTEDSYALPPPPPFHDVVYVLTLPPREAQSIDIDLLSSVLSILIPFRVFHSITLPKPL